MAGCGEFVDHLTAPQTHRLPRSTVMHAGGLDVSVHATDPHGRAGDRSLRDPAARGVDLVDQSVLRRNRIVSGTADVGDRHEPVPQVVHPVVEVRRGLDRLEVVDAASLELVDELRTGIDAPAGEEVGSVRQRSLCVLLVPLAAVEAAAITVFDADHGPNLVLSAPRPALVARLRRPAASPTASRTRCTHSGGLCDRIRRRMPVSVTQTDWRGGGSWSRLP